MSELEQTIHNLEVIRDNSDWHEEERADCQDAINRAIAMLKEQEAVKPITEHKLFLCPVCKNTLFREQKFCHECGKRIEWEGR